MFLSLSPTVRVHTVNSQSRGKRSDKPAYTQLRWDKADRAAYYLNTGRYLQPYANAVQNVFNKHVAGMASVDEVTHCIESTYCSVLSILQSSADVYVPKRRKGFYKFWWNQELNQLKQDSKQSPIKPGKLRANSDLINFYLPHSYSI